MKPHASPFDRAPLRIGITLAAVLLCTRFGGFFTLPPSDISAFWPANALLFSGAFLARGGQRTLTLLLALPTFAVAELWIGYLLLNAVVYSLANTAEVAVLLWLTRKEAASLLAFDSVRPLLVLLLGALVASTVGGGLGGLGVVLGGGDFGVAFLRWTLADFFGYCLLVPLVFTWGQWRRFFPPHQPGRLAEAEVLLVVTLLVTLLSSGSVPGIAAPFGAQFLPLPVLLWAAFRFGPPGGAIATFLVASVVFFSSAHGVGSFATGAPEDNVTSLQLFFVSLVVSVMTIASLNAERRESFDVLRQQMAERGEVEEALRQSERRFRAIFDQTFNFIGLLSVDGTLLQANRTALRFAGVGEDEVLGKPFWSTVWWQHSPELQQRLRTAIERAAGGELVRFEATHIGPGGEVRYVDFSLKPITDVDGRVVQLLPEGRDISERKAMEEALRTSEREFRTLAENIPDHIIRYDALGRKTYINSATARLMGVDPAEVLGQTPEETPPEFRATPLDDFARKLHLVLETGEPQELELSLRHASEGMQIHNVRFAAERDEEGRIVGALMVGRDITRHKHADEELERYRQHLEELVDTRTRELAQARDAAEAANRAKSAFLANMSHELRTPLNAILGFAELMAHDEGLPEAQRRNLDTINRSGRHLLSLINDILEISKIEAGRLSAQLEAFDVRELLETIVDAMALRARQKGLALALRVHERVPRYICSDVVKLRQVLINLLSNALKYTHRGRVDLDATAEAADGERLMLTFVVRDTGVGISADELESIFQPFYQTEQGVRLGEGTGLGLTICRQYAQLLGGEVTATSVEGEGSAFTFRLPVTLADAAEPLPHPRVVLGLAEGQAARRVLVVEDKEDNRRLLEQLMVQAGFETRSATNGEEALAVFEAWHPDFIWMDMRMPVMDGYEATRRIRAWPGGRATHIVALTASVFREDRSDILAAGCDEVLAKPLDEVQLFSVMEGLLGVRFRYAEAPAPTAASTPIDLRRLPPDLRNALCSAARSLDIEATADAIGRMRETYADLAEGLEAMVRAYHYDQVVSLCDESERHDDQDR